MVTDYEKGRRKLVEEVRTLRSKLARLEPVTIRSRQVPQVFAEQEIESLARFPSENPYPVLRVSIDGMVLYANRSSLELLKERGSKINSPAPQKWLKATREALLTESIVKIDVKNKGRVFSISVVPVPEAGYCNFYGADITESRKAEQERDVTIQLLSLMNTTNHTYEMMELVARLLQDWSGCGAVGVRLAEGEDYPYFVTSGFNEEFIRAESKLCSVDEIGEIIRDSDGRPYLECMCGNILSERFDPSKPFFTEHGSFWTNSTTALLAGTDENDRLSRTRNMCNTAGYESVALIPLRVGKKTFGLLQFNDKQEGCFTPEMISLFERLADNLAIGLAQRKAEQALRDSQQRLEATLDAAELGTWDWDWDEGKISWAGYHVKLFGCKEGEFDKSYESFEKRIHHEDLPKLKAAVEEARREKKEYLCEYRVIWPDGSTHWILGNGRCQYDKNGQAVRMLGTVKDITKRKRVESALRESEEKFRSFIHNFQGIAFRGKMDFTPIFCHGSVKKITGYTEQDLVSGKPRWDQIIHPDDLPRFFNEDEEKLHSVPNYSYEREYRIVRKNGQIQWVHEVIQNVCDESGKPVMVQGAVFDITKRKQAEREFISKEQFLNRIIDQSPFATWISDADGVLRRANPALKRMLNVSDEQIVGKYNILKDPLVEQQGLMGLVRSVFERGKTVSFECEWNGEDIPIWDLKGSNPVNIEATMFPIHSPEGKLTNVVMHWIDVTERKKTQTALRESEIRFKELFENMSSGVAIYDAVDNGKDFVFNNMNKAGERIDRVKSEKIIGKKVTKVFPGIITMGLFEVFQRVWRTGKPERQPVSFYKDERLAHWVESYVYKLPYGEIVAVYDDITERKSVEEKLQDYHAKLKAMAISSMLTEEQERQRIAQGLHDDIGQKLAMAKFDLQSSLQSGREYISPELLKKLYGEIDSMIESVRSLTFKLSNPVLTELGLEAAIERHLSREVRDNHGIEYDLERCGLLTNLNEDLNICLFRSIRELLNNVVKHSQAKNIFISISVENHNIIITVKDDGVGFDASKVRSRIGDGGTFGLFSIQEQLEGFGGQFQMQSGIGRGSQFIITVPFSARVSGT